MLVFCLVVSAAFAQDSGQVETAAKNVILVDARSGDILYEKSADTPIPPASMSKLMTQAVVFDLLKSGKLKEDQSLPISENTWRKGGSPSGGSTMYAELNSQVSVINLLRGAIIQSANDACLALAEGISGSEQTFLPLMEAKAKKLGLKNSVFKNVTGLPDPGHQMSVRDLAILARHLIYDHADRFALYGEPSFTWNNIAQNNRNPLLKDYPGADGMKTGFTKEAGYGLVGTALRSNRRLILVVAGLESATQRKEEAERLLDWGFRQYKQVDVFEQDEIVSEARVWGGTQNWVNLVTEKPFSVALSEREKQTVELKLSYQGPLYAPVEARKSVGEVRVYVKGKVIAAIPVVTAAHVPATEGMWEKAWDSALIMIFGG